MPTLTSYSGWEITYNERPDSPQERYSGQQGGATRIFDVPWEFRWDFAQTMVGFSEAVSYVKNGKKLYYIKRYLPQPYPQPLKIRTKDNTEITWMYATDIASIQGLSPTKTDNDGNLEFQYARITIQYSTLTYRLKKDEEMPPRLGIVGDEGWAEWPQKNDDDDLSNFPNTRYITRHIQPTAEYLRLPFGVFKWVYDITETPDDPSLRANVANGAGTIVPSTEVVYTWHQVPFVPRKIRDYLGCVNEFGFDVFESETLLLVAAEVRPYRQIGGLPAYDVVYKMKHFNPPGRNANSNRRGHHNRLLKQEVNKDGWEWRRVSSNGKTTDECIYAKVDFEQLFMYDYV